VCGDFRSTRSAIASSTLSSSDPLTVCASRGSASEHRVPARRLVQTGEQLRPSAQNRSANPGSSWRPHCFQAKPQAPSTLAEPVVDLGREGQRDQPGWKRDRVALQTVRLALAVPALVGSTQRNTGGLVEADPAGELRRQRRVSEQEPANLLDPAHGKRGDPACPRKPAATGARHPQHTQDRLGARLVPVRFQGDVVAEPLRLLVGVGVAVDVPQEARVVGCDQLRLVDADAVCKS
jgi:hypothetical protein